LSHQPHAWGNSRWRALSEPREELKGQEEASCVNAPKGTRAGNSEASTCLYESHLFCSVLYGALPSLALSILGGEMAPPRAAS
jgi:hypothetical protein